MASFKALSNINMEGTRNTTNNDSRCPEPPDRDLNMRPPDYEPKTAKHSVATDSLTNSVSKSCTHGISWAYLHQEIQKLRTGLGRHPGPVL